ITGSSRTHRPKGRGGLTAPISQLRNEVLLAGPGAQAGSTLFFRRAVARGGGVARLAGQATDAIDRNTCGLIHVVGAGQESEQKFRSAMSRIPLHAPCGSWPG